jgi:hypothetical protein
VHRGPSNLLVSSFRLSFSTSSAVQSKPDEPKHSRPQEEAGHLEVESGRGSGGKQSYRLKLKAHRVFSGRCGRQPTMNWVQRWPVRRRRRGLRWGPVGPRQTSHLTELRWIREGLGGERSKRRLRPLRGCVRHMVLSRGVRRSRTA